jgi:molecular chaperone DnaK
VKDEAPLDRLRSLIGELQGVSHGLAAAASGAGPGGPSTGDGARTPSGVDDDGMDDVIDAEFTAS